MTLGTRFIIPSKFNVNAPKINKIQKSILTI